MDAVEWGTVPDWFAAFGTVGALFLTYRLLKHEITERRAAAEEARWAQARRVSFTIGSVEDYVAVGATSERWHSFTCTVSNPSGEPISDVAMTIDRGDGFRVPDRWDVVPSPGAGEVAFTDAALDPGGVRGHVDFTDARGHRWRRHSDGRLEEVVDPGAAAVAPESAPDDSQ